MTDHLLDRVLAAIGDRYEIEGELGRGGMAVVYRAREVRLRRIVALKVLPPELAFRTGVRERFLREAQTAAQLTHPHIVPVFAADDSGGVAWLAMALVEGETLGERLVRVPQSPIDEARRILAEVADALAYAHARGVVHRDIKPDNILLDRDSGRATVTDFGIARAAEEELRLTVTGVAIGSPAYMSPEQAMGEAELDGRSDLYSLGVVAYQLITGVLPFQAASATGMLMKHVGEAPRAVATLRPTVPAPLAAAIEQALAKKPGDRWPDAAAFRRALLDPRSSEAFGVPAGPSAAAPSAAPPAPRGDSPTMAMPGLQASPRLPAAPAPLPAPTNVRDALADAMRRVDRALADDGTPGLGTPRQANVGRNGARDGARDGARGGGAPDGGPPPTGRQSPDAWRAEQRQTEREWKEHLREQRRDFKERQRDQQEQWREYRRGDAAQGNLPVPLHGGNVPGNAPLGGMPGAAMSTPPVPGAYPPLPLERRADMFRRKAMGSIALLVFLTAVNAIHLFIPPWVIFPAFGIVGDLRRRWRPLHDEGLAFWELMLEGPQNAIAGAQARPAHTRGAAQLLARRAQRFRRRAFQVPGFLLVAGLTAVIGAATGADPLIVVFAGFMLLAVWAAFGALRNGRHLRRAGIPLRVALSSQWAESMRALEPPRPREEVLAEEAARLASAAVLAGPYGAPLRSALDDRLVVRDTLAKLAPADRALIPDILPTVDALVERIAGLVQSLARIEDDVRPGQLESLGARLAQARLEPPHAPDRDRKLALLERQQASLTDLGQRRATMLAQLESAQLVLQNVKLDLLKLRSAGVGALAEVTSATQEARALSRDIQYALDAAAEVRSP